MKRSMQWTVLVFLVSALLAIFAGCVQPFDDDDDAFLYPIDTEYALSGPYANTQVSVHGYIIFYPKRMNGGHPVITWGNGTGAAVDSYEALLRHLASWGFVVIASESPKTGSGLEMIQGIDYMLEQNKTPGSLFYGQLDPERIGATGHSQGGGGAINTATDPRVKCTVPIAPARGEIDQVKCPIFLIAGTLDSIVPAYFVRNTSYKPAEAPTIFGIVQGMGHGGFAKDAGKARGYITAWFMYQLQEDAYAAQAFMDECEMCNNSDWEVLKKNF